MPRRWSTACPLLIATLANAAHADVYDTLYAHILAPPRTLAHRRAAPPQAAVSADTQPEPSPPARPPNPPQAGATRVQARGRAPHGADAPDVPFVELILLASRLHRVSPALIHAVISVESNFNPNARSRVGALGLMQLMPSTAAALGVRNPRDPLQNVLGGARYLRQLLDRFRGNVRHALSAYNAGPAVVRRYRGVPPYRDVKRYLRRVLSRYHRLQPRYSHAASAR